MRSLGKSNRLVQSLGLISLVACGGSTVTDQPGITPPVDTTKPPTTTVQRGSVTVRVVLDPADSSLARQAGIGVNGLTVRLTSSRAGDPARTAVTTADGTVRFDNLLEGVYTAATDRTLTAVEVARLAPGDREASVFAGAGQATLSPPGNASATVPIIGARRGSVVISEVFFNYGPLQYVEPNYVWGAYIEVYNNADTTSYLDGMLLAMTPSTWHTDNTWNGTCTDHPKRLRLDSTAVYTSIILAFPGTGRDYPIRPGEARVVAMDAMNHMIAGTTKEQVDLSRAHFEQFWTDADVDNPESVNMIKVVGPASGVFGRGISYNSSGMHVLLSPGARAASTQVTLPTMSASGPGTFEYTRLPSEYILDILSQEYTPYVFLPEDGDPRCRPWTADRYDRAPAYLRHNHQRKSVARKSLGFTADGREILQRTKSSERDLQWADPLRRSLNK